MNNGFSELSVRDPTADLTFPTRVTLDPSLWAKTIWCMLFRLCSPDQWKRGGTVIETFPQGPIQVLYTVAGALPCPECSDCFVAFLKLNFDRFDAAAASKGRSRRALSLLRAAIASKNGAPGAPGAFDNQHWIEYWNSAVNKPGAARSGLLLLDVTNRTSGYLVGRPSVELLVHLVDSYNHSAHDE
jgi:hypothetical protein